jgi:hypothetical protein
VALWLVAGYIAGVALVRLMRHRRDLLVGQFRAQVALRRRQAGEPPAHSNSESDNVESNRHKPAA